MYLHAICVFSIISFTTEKSLHMVFQRWSIRSKSLPEPGAGEVRRHRGRTAAAVLGAGAIVVSPLALAVPAQGTASTAPMLKAALIGDIDTLNPFLSVLATGSDILTFQYENLVQFGAENNEIVPGIADSWETSEDGTVWTYTLPGDALWSDGEPLTAEDVAWTYNAIMEIDELKQANGSLVENFVSVEAPDDTTVEITLSEAQAPNPGADIPVVPEHIWGALEDPATFENAADTVGSGPFVITSYDQAAGVQLASNPNYRHGEAKVSGLTYVPYKNTDAAVQALKTGEVDIVSGLTPAQFQALESEPTITVNEGTGRRYTALAVNPGALDSDGKPLGNGNPALQDQVLRQAIARAVDNATLLSKVRQGLGILGTGEVPTTYPLYHWDAAPEELVLSFDPEAANKMLDDAGYTAGPDGIRADKSGNPLSLRLMGRSTDPTHQQMADYIKPWLRDIGIDVTTEMKAPAQVNDDSTVGNYDMYFTGWGMGPDPDFQLSINQCSSRPNADGTGATSESNWCSPEFDELYLAQHTELDQEKRSELVIQAQKEIYNAAVNNVIYYGSALEAYRSDRFTGFVTQPSESGVISSQNGPWGLYSATPVSAIDTASETSPSPAPWIVGGAFVLVLVAGAVVLLRRRAATADDRE